MIIVYRGGKPFEKFAGKTFFKDIPQHAPDHFRGNLAEFDHFELWSLGDNSASASVFVKLPLQRLDLFCASVEPLKRIIEEHPTCSFVVSCHKDFEQIIPEKFRNRCTFKQSYTPSEERACPIQFDLTFSNLGIKNRIDNAVNRKLLSNEQAILQGASLWDIDEGLQTTFNYIELDAETTNEIILINPWLDDKKLQKDIPSLIKDFKDHIGFEVTEITDEITPENINQILTAEAVISLGRSYLTHLSAYLNKPSFTMIENMGNPNDIQLNRFPNHFLAGADVLQKGAEAVVSKVCSVLGLVNKKDMIEAVESIEDPISQNEKKIIRSNGIPDLDFPEEKVEYATLSLDENGLKLEKEDWETVDEIEIETENEPDEMD